MSHRLLWLLVPTVLLAMAAPAGEASASSPIGSCPRGGFELFAASMFAPEIVELVDLNRDGLVCGKRLPTPFGGLIIDNPVRSDQRS